jgi:hypothetical protein
MALIAEGDRAAIGAQPYWWPNTMMLLTPEELAPEKAAYIGIERRTP